MREIKFRAWVPADDNEPGYMISGDDLAFEEYLPLKDLLSRDGIMQYTGLKDVKDLDIYEGDVVKGKYFANGGYRRIIGTVEYVGVGFRVEGTKKYQGWPCDLNGLFEVIGNVYEGIGGNKNDSENTARSKIAE